MIVRRTLIIGAGVLVGVSAAAGWWWRPKFGPTPTAVAAAGSKLSLDEEPPEGEQIFTVKTIHPKRDRAFTVSVQQFCTVEAYYQAELRARVSGIVKFIPKDVGGRVSQGELLVEIDVPDLRQEVAQKEAVVEQRRQELRVAQAQLKTAKAHIEVARAAIEQAETQVAQARATRDLREKRFHRFQIMLAQKAVNENVVDEEERDFLAAQAAWEAAKVAVKRTNADLHEKEASLEAAKADNSLKESLIQVARCDRDRAVAMADYARLVAPFDGVVVDRGVDLGAFVQNATSAMTKPLVTIARTDIVTVVSHLPDNVAPFIKRDTRVLLQLDDLPGVILEGRVTRFAPSVLNADRTMQVEIDLFNGSPQQHAQFLSQYFACQLNALKAANPIQATVLAAAGREVIEPKLKSITDPLPILPQIRAGATERPALLPGMSGQMKVLLQKFGDAFLLPSRAIFSRGGKPYVAVVQSGKVHRIPVRVQVNDGVLAKVAIIAQGANAHTGELETLRDLKGDEQVIVSRQSELSEGQPVRAFKEDW